MSTCREQKFETSHDAGTTNSIGVWVDEAIGLERYLDDLSTTHESEVREAMRGCC